MGTIVQEKLAVQPIITTNMVTASGDVNTMGALGAPFNYVNRWSPALDPTKPGVTLMGAAGGNRDMWLKWDLASAAGSAGRAAQIGLINFRMLQWGNLGSWQLQGCQVGDDETDWHNIGEVFNFDGWPEQEGSGIKQIPAPWLPQPNKGYGYAQYSGIAPGSLYTNTLYFRRFRIIGVSDSIPTFPWASIGGPVFTLAKPMVFLPVFADNYPSQKPLPSDYDEYEFITSVDGPGYPQYDDVVQPDGSTGGTVTPPGYPDQEDPTVTALKNLPGNQYGGIWGWADRTTESGRGTVTLAWHGADVINNQREDHDNNYGFASGNGIVMSNGISSPGEYFEWTFTEPQQVFTIRFIRPDAGSGAYGTWQLCSVADDNTNIPLGPPQPWTYVQINGVWQYEFQVKYSAPIKSVVRLVRTDGPGFIANRWWNESNFRIINTSGVFKGDRRSPGTTGPSKRVIVSASFPPQDRSSLTGTRTDAQIWDYLVDGQINTGNGDLFPNPPGLSLGTSAKPAAFGDWLKFTFPRGVLLKKVSFVLLGGDAETSATIPNQWGKWLFQRSFDNATWQDIGSAQTFPVGRTAPLFNVDQASQGGTPASYWRMKLVEGTPNLNRSMTEVEFDVADIGEPTPSTLGASFVDETVFMVRLTSSDPAVTDPGHIKINFKDDAGFTALPTLQSRLAISARFADDAGFDFYSDALAILNVVQLVTYQTGRNV